MSKEGETPPAPLRARTDAEIAASSELRPIVDVAVQDLGLSQSDITTYGRYKAKIDFIRRRNSSSQAPSGGKIVLVTGVSPTPAGEGKTTTTLGLNDALNLIGVRSTACLREPSLGPVFGMKGGAHGGGKAQVAPMVDINLHFNGDIHAITSANNLLSSLLDNHFYWGNQLNIDPERVFWNRVLDISDRALRSLNLSIRKSLSRQEAFNITAASEVMAILCLSENIEDLERRLGNIVVGLTYDGEPITAQDLEAVGAMVVLLKDALNPNLVQSLEGHPVLVHGGPFANIAHGCNSVIATRTALELSDVVVTEAGFGSDLGGEKFFDIKCRTSGLFASACVIVCTIRSIKMHGGIPKNELLDPHPESVAEGSKNLKRHIDIVRQFGLNPIVAINCFDADTEEELSLVKQAAMEEGSPCCLSRHWRDGGTGAAELAETVCSALADTSIHSTRFLYPDELPLKEKIESVATNIYRASGVVFEKTASADLQKLTDLGYGHLPVCIAKTQYSFTADPKVLGAAEGHALPVREVHLSAGAGFVVVVAGAIMTMPGLPRVPAANTVAVGKDGTVVGIN